MSNETEKYNQDNQIESAQSEEMRAADGEMTEIFWRRQVGILRTSFVNTALIIINIIVFVYSIFGGEALLSRFEYRSDLIIAGYDYYRLVTSMVLHADAEHLFSNMLILFFVGANVEHDVGHIPYLLLYFFSGIVGNALSTLYDMYTGTFIPSIGASGAVFGVIGAVAVIVLFGRKNLKRGSNLMIRLGLMIFLSLYSGFRADNIDNAAHIGGLLGGMLFALIITLILKKEYTMEEWL